jgi:RNA polymerase sigma-70 factor (ECF subfamily)
MAIERWEEFADEELVLAALLGEIAAFDVLVLRYRPGVLAAVSRQISHRGVAEDICQETFLLAFKALPQLNDASRFGAWLHAIARRQAIRVSRGEARAAHSPLDELILSHSEVLGESGWDTLERQEQHAFVRQAVAALPEEFQLVVRLRYWGDMPLERIAAFLGLPLSTVKWRLHRARALMRERLNAAATDAAEPPRRQGQDAPPRGRIVRRTHEPGTRRSASRAAAPCGAAR